MLSSADWTLSPLPYFAWLILSLSSFAPAGPPSPSLTFQPELRLSPGSSLAIVWLLVCFPMTLWVSSMKAEEGSETLHMLSLLCWFSLGSLYHFQAHKFPVGFHSQNANSCNSLPEGCPQAAGICSAGSHMEQVVPGNSCECGLPLNNNQLQWGYKHPSSQVEMMLRVTYVVSLELSEGLTL